MLALSRRHPGSANAQLRHLPCLYGFLGTVNRYLRTFWDPTKSTKDILQFRHTSWTIPTREQIQWRNHLEKHTQEYSGIIQTPTGNDRDLALGSFVGRWLTITERYKTQIPTEKAMEMMRINATEETWDSLVAGPVMPPGVAHWRSGNLHALPTITTPAESFFAIWKYTKTINKEEIFLDKGFQHTTFYHWHLNTSWNVPIVCKSFTQSHTVHVIFPTINTSNSCSCCTNITNKITWHPGPPRNIVPNIASSGSTTRITTE